MILRLFRWLGGLVAILVGLAALYLGVALALGAVSVNAEFKQAESGIDIAVCSNGVHTDFVLPVKSAEMDWSSAFPPHDFGVPVTAFDHVGIGWGDLDFYRSTPTWADFKLSTALHAALGLGPAALHVQYRPGPGPVEKCRRLRVDSAE